MNALAACINAVILVAAALSMLGSAAMFHVWRTQRRIALEDKITKSGKML